MLKKSIYISVAVALLTVSSMAKNGEGHHSNKKQQKQGQQVSENINIASFEKEGLVFMIEEEKLARDVYTTLNDIWYARIFRKISQAEQKHMDAVENLLSKYNLLSPSTLDSIGKFENAELQNLYNELIEKGKNSYVDALEVGVIIEETDITDLQELMDAGSSEDIENVYERLLNGSYKHLDAFNRQISRQ